MTYSLVNMPVLGFDLCRLAGGTELAEILLRTLRLEASHLSDLAAVPRAPRPRPTAAPALAGALAELREWQRDPHSPDASVRAVRTLERSLLGDFDALVRLVRDDILSWTWHETGPVRFQHPDAVAATDLVVDLLAAAYGDAPERLPEVPHVTAGGPPVAHDIDLGPCGDQVRATLDGIASITPSRADALRAAAGGSGRSRWAGAVHDASWAVYLAGRLRPAAAAQLLAVRAFAAAGFTARDGAYGVWNVISGAVQAAVVADMVSEDTAELLTAAVRGALDS